MRTHTGERPFKCTDCSHDESSVDPAITNEVAHHQYEEDKIVDLVKALNNEIRAVYCEAFKNTEFVYTEFRTNSLWPSNDALRRNW